MKDEFIASTILVVLFLIFAGMWGSKDFSNFGPNKSQFIPTQSV